MLCIHAIGSEVVQMWIPTRTSDVWDAIYNLGRVACGFVIFSVAEGWLSNRSREMVVVPTSNDASFNS